MRCLSLHPGNVALHSCRALLSMKRALSVLLYAADHGKLNDGDSFTTKLNNCVLTISLKDGSLDVQFDPDADVAVDTPYTLDMKLDIYEEKDNG